MTLIICSLLFIAAMANARNLRVIADSPKVLIRSAPPIPHYRSAVHDVFVKPYNRDGGRYRFDPFSHQEPKAAIAKLTGNAGVEGVIRIEQSLPPSGPIRIFGNITGLRPGPHGFHIHQKGDITGGCGSTGSHYNPAKLDHGAKESYARHVGDLGNIIADQNGVAHIDTIDDIASLTGHYNILGRAFVVHEKEDDLGRGGDDGSRKTGNAGGRLACGVIGLVE
ncbi:uncharacterized protein LOC136039552 isoform X1 [Artemia franciscana]|uniref:Superoxide dismutase [Cu-Zn] n=1 Tax=Artemia franciscana TaxID=6661 RepID=A0AA88L963_ARTSF|nr:hypothetical protein QYM36_007261 [Artemia franciscana]